ncbi:MAG: EpsG family protein [bacterium]|nr:EpsG family protein [bacterium]MCM1374841.1 EpsG family protein [Muribaculum sp.]
MILFVGVTALVLATAFFCNTSENAQLYTEANRRVRTRGGMTRQQALNLWLCAGIYVVLSALSACRIASGNDYWVYSRMFSLIAQGRHVSSEFGFNMLVRVMQYFFGTQGYSYLPIFGLFSLLTVYFFLRAIYEQGEWFLGSMFLFLMNGYYFSSFNSVRYYLVLAIALYSTKYVLRGEYLKFLLWILTAATFHKSVLVVIPIYLGAKWLAGTRLRLWHYIAGALLILSLLFGRDIYRYLIFKIYPFYENSMFDTVDYSLTNIGKCGGALILSLICYRSAIKDNARNRFYFFLNLGGLALYTCGAFIPEVSRVAYYLILPQIFLIPNLLRSIEKPLWRRLLTAGTALVFAAYFALFLRSAYDVNIRLLPYLNWIFN